MQKHTTSFDYFDLIVDVTDEGDVRVELAFPEAVPSIGMEWDTLREVIHFVGIHGLGMQSPFITEEDKAEAAGIA